MMSMMKSGKDTSGDSVRNIPVATWQNQRRIKTKTPPYIWSLVLWEQQPSLCVWTPLGQGGGRGGTRRLRWFLCTVFKRTPGWKWEFMVKECQDGLLTVRKRDIVCGKTALKPWIRAVHTICVAIQRWEFNLEYSRIKLRFHPKSQREQNRHFLINRC